MRLPGGYWDGSECRRDFALKPISGKVELAIAECAVSDAPVAGKVTAVLAAALEHVGGIPADTSLVSDLAVADRQFLMRHVAAAIGSGATWVSAVCGVCEGRFDVGVDQAALPAKEAGPDFPYAAAHTSQGSVRLRVPTGADQEAVAAIADDSAAVRTLASRCVIEAEDGRELREWDGADLARIEAALEAAAPEVATLAEAACPECGQHNEVYVDPYACLATADDNLFDEIHQVASTYHWSEEEILALPRERRQIYLARIDRARGFAHRAQEEVRVGAAN